MHVCRQSNIFKKGLWLFNVIVGDHMKVVAIYSGLLKVFTIVLKWQSTMISLVKWEITWLLMNLNNPYVKKPCRKN